MALSVMEKLGFGEKVKVKAEDQALATLRAKSKVNKKQLKFDLFTHVSYMASLATSKASREVMFTRAAMLNLESSRSSLRSTRL